jgi:hypothetical protein
MPNRKRRLPIAWLPSQSPEGTCSGRYTSKAAREFYISLDEGNPADSILVEAAVRFIKRGHGDEAA